MTSYPAAYLEFINLFNDEKFFEAHEVLETLWQEETEDVRYFYQGLIQIAAIFVHIQEETPKGCPKILVTATKHLESFMPSYGGLDLVDLLTKTQATLSKGAAYPRIVLLN